MTVPVLFCILALALAVVILTIISAFQSREISELKTFKLAVDEEIFKIENKVNFHSARFKVNSKTLYNFEEELKKLEERVHTLEINQNIVIGNEK